MYHSCRRFFTRYEPSGWGRVGRYLRRRINGREVIVIGITAKEIDDGVMRERVFVKHCRVNVGYHRGIQVFLSFGFTVNFFRYTRTGYVYCCRLSSRSWWHKDEDDPGDGWVLLSLSLRSCHCYFVVVVVARRQGRRGWGRCRCRGKTTTTRMG